MQDYISLKGVRVNNLKNINVDLKRGDLIVLTGVSGSGKSSLAFETLFAEGQRKYIESLSTYARQFIHQLPKPDADFIAGICPTLALEQKKSRANIHSIVATSTEIYEYLKILFARIGKTYAPQSGKIVKKHTPKDVIDFIYKYDQGTSFSILAPLVTDPDRNLKTELEIYLQKGFGRIQVADKTYFIEDLLKDDKRAKFGSELKILIYRNKVAQQTEEDYQRLADAIDNAFFEGRGTCLVEIYGTQKTVEIFSSKFEADGQTFEEPSPNFFNFNNALGACPQCQGTGREQGILKDKVILDPNLPLENSACLANLDISQKTTWIKRFSQAAADFPLHKPYVLLSQAEQNLVWEGNEKIEGLYRYFENLKSKNRYLYNSFLGKTTCRSCRGGRLRSDTNYVKIAGKTINDLTQMRVENLNDFLEQLVLEPHELKIAKIIKAEIYLRTKYLMVLGLGYLHLNRLTQTLSGGEFQRIQLASALGKGLVNVMYILDEPSIGLHPRDIDKLVQVIQDLQAQDNTVVVVEHEESIMKAADSIIDIGPGAGHQGGEIVFRGDLENLKNSDSLTAQYLTHRKSISVPKQRRQPEHFIKLTNIHHNNIKNIDLDIPLQVLVAVTGVSGSGKSTLVVDILYQTLTRVLVGQELSKHRLERIEFDSSLLKNVEYVSQNPIGRSSRSNCATYIGAWDEIRALFARQPLALERGYVAAYFSFNALNGLCAECEGTGFQKIDMRFMDDLKLTCETCKGKRFIDEVLEATYKGKNIHDVLLLTVAEAIEFFSTQVRIVRLLKILQTVGLDYMSLGQTSSTFSGGEAQRLKIAAYLLKSGRASVEPSLFIFDEPTTGLHFEDVAKLLKAFEALLGQGHSIIVIEHNLDLIKSADWIIDLGPESGIGGGQVCFEGLPEDLVKKTDNLTAKYLKTKMPYKTESLN